MALNSIFSDIGSLFGGGDASPVQPTGGVSFQTPGSLFHSLGIGQTRQEFEFQREEEERRRAQLIEQQRQQQMRGILERIQQIRAANPNAAPHEVFNQIIQDPGFADAFVSIGADQFTGMVNDIMQAVQPPKPEQFTLSAGEARFDETGRMIAERSPAKIQEYEYLKTLSPEQRAALAEVINQFDEGKSTQAERAVARMRELGWIDDRTALGILGGTLKVVTERDAAGNPIGHTLVDLTSKTAMPLGTPTQPRLPGEAPVPGQPDAPVDPNEEPGKRLEDLSRLDDPASMFDAVGIIPRATEVLGGIAGQFVPELAAPEINAKRAALSAYRAALMQMHGVPRLKSVMELMMEQMPDMSGRSNPQQELIKAMTVRQRLETELDALQDELVDPAVPANVKREAGEAAQRIRSVLRAMPTREQMNNRLKMHREGRIPLGLGELKERASGAARATTEAIASGGASLEGGRLDIPNMTREQIERLTPDQIKQLPPEQKRQLRIRIRQLKEQR